MQPLYIQFQTPKTPGASPEGRFYGAIKTIIKAILGKFIPIANPDFENRFHEVNTWLVECDSEDGTPLREIGLDENGTTIVKMPFKENYGYWTDNNLLLEDFKKQFQVQVITQEMFEKKWVMLD